MSKTFIVETSARHVHLSEADFIVEGEHEPLPLRTYKDPTETDIAIAKHVVKEIPDGAVLSLGVGGVPFTVAKMLAEGRNYLEIGEETGASSATISRVNKCLQFGSGGYLITLERLK